MTVKERIKLYLRTKQISERYFCQTIGVSSGYVNAIRVSIQPDKLMRIQEHFPDLNPAWILTGDGNMLLPIGKRKKKLPTSREHNLELEQLYHLIKSKDQEISELKRMIKQLQKEVSAQSKSSSGGFNQDS